MRGSTLSAIRSMLKAEIGDYSGTNAIRDAELGVLISNKQKVLATEYYWPFLQQTWDQAIAVGTRYATLTSTLAGNPETGTAVVDLDKLPIVTTFYNNVYHPVIYGINEDELNAINASLGNRSDPIQRWRMATNVNEVAVPNQFEVWPVPNTAQTLRFTGERTLQTLTSDSHTADLDDMLLVLFVAADICTRKKSPDAQLKLQQANRRLQWLRQGQTVKTVRRTMDDGGDAQWQRERKLTGMRIIVS